MQLSFDKKSCHLFTHGVKICFEDPPTGLRQQELSAKHIQDSRPDHWRKRNTIVVIFIQFIKCNAQNNITWLEFSLQKLLQINIILAKIYFRGLPNFGDLFWLVVGVSLDVNWGVRLVGLTLLLLFCYESLEDLINPLRRLSITCPDVWELKAMS